MYLEGRISVSLGALGACACGVCGRLGLSVVLSLECPLHPPPYRFRSVSLASKYLADLVISLMCVRARARVCVHAPVLLSFVSGSVCVCACVSAHLPCSRCTHPESNCPF